MEYATLSSGRKIPRIGLGTWESPKGEVGQAIKDAIDIGYRHLDFAAVYGNEKEIGKALSEVFKSGKVKREDLFITSKLWNDQHRPDHVLQACKRTLSDLQIDYLDLYLIHWPVAFVPPEEIKSSSSSSSSSSQFPKLEFVSLRDTWKEMENLVKTGLVRDIGVSNFPLALLNDLLSYASIKPVVNQIEMHPFNSQTLFYQYCNSINILCTAYSPLARVGTDKVKGEYKITSNPTILSLSSKYNKTPPQIVLRWHYQRFPNSVILPKSTHKERIKENFSIFDFKLDKEDMELINSLDCGLRVCNPIEDWGFPPFS